MQQRFRRVYEATVDQITVLQLLQEVKGISHVEHKQLEFLKTIRKMLKEPGIVQRENNRTAILSC